ncbi:dTMP kinase [Streptomyces sp. BBFR51]|uniref:dTMP kinase n=1 Tax=Streptomyces sp. BBFR51 TaxID=3372856 RepID=UPI0037DCE51E
MSLLCREPGKLITFVGGDGAGKSTLAARLHQALNDAGHTAVLIGKHSTDVPKDSELSAYLDRLKELVYRRDVRVAQACGDHSWRLALASWYTLQDRLVVQPTLAAGTYVILDNAHHKILARYAVNPEVSPRLCDQVFAHLTGPACISRTPPTTSCGTAPQGGLARQEERRASPHGNA